MRVVAYLDRLTLRACFPSAVPFLFVRGIQIFHLLKLFATSDHTFELEEEENISNRGNRRSSAYLGSELSLPGDGRNDSLFAVL